jgi:hypothetical protein
VLEGTEKETGLYSMIICVLNITFLYC